MVYLYKESGKISQSFSMWYGESNFKKLLATGWRQQLVCVEGNLWNLASGWRCLSLFFMLLVIRPLVIFMRMFCSQCGTKVKNKKKRNSNKALEGAQGKLGLQPINSCCT